MASSDLTSCVVKDFYVGGFSSPRLLHTQCGNIVKALVDPAPRLSLRLDHPTDGCAAQLSRPRFVEPDDVEGESALAIGGQNCCKFGPGQRSRVAVDPPVVDQLRG